jgi:hypothetical protein
MKKDLDHLKTRYKLLQQPAGASPGSQSNAPLGGIILLAAGLLLAACSVLPGSRPQADNLSNLGSQVTPFLPPTLGPATPKSPPQTPTVASAQPLSPASACSDKLVFLDDLSIKDGTVFQPGAQLDKRWKVENGGTCNWDQHYRMKLIAGSELGVPAEQALYPARSGSQAVIRIVFTAPAEAGNYRSAWQAYNPQGDPFGDPFFIDIVVAAPTAAP